MAIAISTRRIQERTYDRPNPKPAEPGLKLALELGPLLIYFLITFKVHERFGFDWGEEVYRPAVIWLIISTPIQVAFCGGASEKFLGLH